MLFYENWRNYLDPTNSLLLMEARVKDVVAKYPTLKTLGMIDFGKNSIEATLGPRGVSKYLLWFSRELRHNFKNDLEELEDSQRAVGQSVAAGAPWLGPDENLMREVAEAILEMIFSFHDNQQRMTNKDIYKYNSANLQAELRDMGPSKAARLRAMKDEETAKKNSDLIYNDHSIMAIRPLTTQASCFYGHNPRLTTWCISTKTSKNYFKQYTEQEGKAFVIARFFGIPENESDHIVSLQFQGDRFVTYWNAPNQPQDPENLLGLIRRHLDGVYNKQASDAIANFRPEPKYDEDQQDELASEIYDELITRSFQAIEDNPPPDPWEGLERAAQEVQTQAEQTLDHVTVHYQVEDSYAEPEDDEPPVRLYFGADLNLNIVYEGEEEYENAPKKLEDMDRNDIIAAVRGIEYRLRDHGMYAFYDLDFYTDRGSLIVEMRINSEDEPSDLDGFKDFVATTCKEIDDKVDEVIEIIKNYLTEKKYRVYPGQQMEFSNLDEELAFYFLGNSLLTEKAKSRNQQKFFGMVRRCQQTGKGCDGEIGKVAKKMKKKDVKDFAKTKHKNLPELVSEVDEIGVSIEDYFQDNVVDEGPLETDQKDKLIFILSKALPNVDRGDLFNSTEQQLLDLLTKLREKQHGL